MKNKTLLFDGKGMKSVDIWGDNMDGWTVLSGDGKVTADEAYYRLIPTLYRAVQIISYYISSMPFALMKGKTEYDTSQEWENKVGFMPNPFTTLQMIASSLEIAGRCYLFRERNIAMTKELYYCLPDSVRVKIKDGKHEIEYFERSVSGMTAPIKYTEPEKDFVYFWLPDPYVEMGPAKNYPAKAAMDACGVLLNMDVFAANFFEHGAVKVTLLTVTGQPAEAERQKLADWWRRVVGGVKNAFGAQVISADAVKPIVIGEGIKELENNTIAQDKREDVAIALGIPMSILFANSANYATAQQDELNFLNMTIIPLCQFIESVLNEQLFEPLGLEWHFLPETLDAMQEDETSRAVALGQLTGAGIPLLMAMDILGYEITDEQRTELEQAVIEKEKKAEELAKQMAAKPPETTPAQEEEGQTEQTSQSSQEDNTFKSELDKWRRKAVNAIKKGKPANVDFVTTCIPQDTYQTIASALGNAKSEQDVKDAFGVTSTPDVKYENPTFALVNELNRANNLLEESMKMVPEQQPQTVHNVFNLPEQKPTFNFTIPNQDITVNVPKQEQPAPIVNVNVPKQDPPTIKVAAPEQPVINVNVPKQDNPVINVNVPKQDAPTVKVAAAEMPVINVNVPQQAPPTVNVNVPEQKTPMIVMPEQQPPVVNVNVPKQERPIVNVNIPEDKPKKATVTRDHQGKITGIEEK